MEGKIPNTYEEVNQLFDNVIQNLAKIRDKLMNNKDDAKKLYEIAKDLDDVDANLFSIKAFVMAQIYLYSEYYDGQRIY